MARPSPLLLLVFFAVLLALLPETTQLQPSQAWTLFKIQQLLNHPPMLSHWRRGTDFCGGGGGSIGPLGTVAVVCYGDTVTQLHIAGAAGSPPLPENFSIGDFVTTLSWLPDLKVLMLSSLGLWGSLPGKLGQLAALEILSISGNYLSGGIPKGMSRLIGLQTLVLNDNMLGGEVPAWIGTLPSLAVLSLRNNSLQGAVPESIGRMPSLRSLVLASNNLSGNLPDMSRLTNLQVIDVGGNSLGPAFPRLGRKVVTVVLSRNKFGGGLPEQLSSFYLLERLDVSWNRFVGPFTPALLSLPSIRYLSIAGNRFTGTLSDKALCGGNLRFVDLSTNLLVGSVPTCLTSPDKSPDTEVLVGANCLDNSDGSQHPSPFCQNQALAVGIVPGKERKSIARQAGFVTGIVMAVLVAVSVVGVMVLFAVKKVTAKGAKARALATSVEEHVSSASSGYPSKLLADARYISQTVKLGALGIPSYRSFSLVELEAATNNFENSYLLGQDSHGEMYRGRLGNGTPVTIRTLKIKRSQTSQSFNRHIDTISRLRHQHLVSALGHCFEYDLDDSTVTQLYIVFEYVQNGNLRSRISQGTEGCKLTWAQRISAAIGVTKGIQFLHGGIIPGIVGNNLRITNILLDQNHVAKIGSYNIPILAEAVKPQIGAGSKFQIDSPMYSDKTDIFDFGVILLEVVSGRTITSIYEVEILKELLQWAIADEDRVRRRSFVDPAVRKGCSDESLRTVMEICLRCLAKEAAQRPSVEDVLWNLQFAAQVQDDWEGDARSSDGSPVPSSSRVTRSSRLSLSR
ncbi:probable inactive leucine-rich repeat receptor-like protein kinase At3g03770 [Phragmites australis]|uniref:probable inactive leucine-rich repeat receptor-like protein kinase At3g03770 n=1 Tax=Phragmites australis TaxID=29695 RepID=UPI002D76AAA3|nr:probable inactive leucine-rich repeat receptor-like protein kinase At3g03770 [Phragmites australis]XP_062212650.1 probable inactive leucine-rich repeat receptor-like protein kinase At3g03770 [Phragmites australis]